MIKYPRVDCLIVMNDLNKQIEGEVENNHTIVCGCVHVRYVNLNENHNL